MQKLIFIFVLLISGTCFAAEPVVKADARSSGEVKVKLNQRYSKSAGRYGFCDVYQPAGPAIGAGYPVVVVVHGGGWISGDKWTLEGYCRSLAQAGIVAISVNYRLAPDHKFPSQLDDVREAMLWTQRRSQSLSIDMDRLGLFGYSAGGHLVLLTASLADESMEVQASASDWPLDDPRWKRLPKAKAVCAGGPPCDFQNLPIDNTAMAYFLGGSRRERPELYAAASPLAHVSKADPVSMIIHGDQDIIVPIAGSQIFVEKQKKLGVRHQLSIIPGQGHMMTFLNPKTRQIMVRFFRDQFGLH